MSAGPLKPLGEPLPPGSVARALTVLECAASETSSGPARRDARCPERSCATEGRGDAASRRPPDAVLCWCDRGVYRRRLRARPGSFQDRRPAARAPIHAAIMSGAAFSERKRVPQEGFGAMVTRRIRFSANALRTPWGVPAGARTAWPLARSFSSSPTVKRPVPSRT